MNDTKMAAGARFPDLKWDSVAGTTIAPASESGWRMLVVYRGKHCPKCKAYLDQLQEMLAEFAAADISVAAISADTRDKAETQAGECDWTFPIGHGLTPDQMRQLGLYVSEPRSAQETDRPFAEPGLFVINPQGTVQIVDISNSPFSRPDLKVLLGGIRFIIDKGYPIRGTA